MFKLSPESTHKSNPDNGSPFFSPMVQRSPSSNGDEKKPATSGKDAGQEKDKFHLGDWLHKKVYETLAKEVGEAKLKEYAKQIAKKATEFVAAEAKEEGQTTTMLSEAMNKKLFEHLEKEVSNIVQEILLSPEVTKVKDAILKEIKGNPAAALGAVLAALAGAYFANIPLKAKGSVDLDKNKKFKLDLEGDLGKTKDIDLDKLAVGFRYVGKKFQSGISAEYGSLGKDKGDGFSATATTKIGTKEDNVALEAQAKSDGSMALKVKPEFTLGVLKLQGELGASNATPKPLYGSALVRVGSDRNFFSSSVLFKPDGSLELGSGFGYKPRLPWRTTELSVSGSLTYDPTKNILKPNIGLTGAYKPRINGYDMQLGLSGNLKAKDPAMTSGANGINLEVMITFTIFDKPKKR